MYSIFNPIICNQILAHTGGVIKVNMKFPLRVGNQCSVQGLRDANSVSVHNQSLLPTHPDNSPSNNQALLPTEQNNSHNNNQSLLRPQADRSLSNNLLPRPRDSRISLPPPGEFLIPIMFILKLGSTTSEIT